jgi:hypothetical protein
MGFMKESDNAEARFLEKSFVLFKALKLRSISGFVENIFLQNFYTCSENTI